jgi:arylsulfatase A-like enzyme
MEPRLRIITLFFAAAISAAMAGERPNVILMMADDLGWGDTGFNGNKKIRTPHLDAMARAGLCFTRFYAASAVCSPTRGSALTGRHPYRYGVVTANAGHMKSEEITLAELLRMSGYTTGHFGKWHLGTLTKTVRDSNRGGRTHAEHYSPPWDNGFDECFSAEAKTPTYDPMWQPEVESPQIGWDFIPDLAQAHVYGTYYWTGPGQVAEDNLEGDDSRVIMDRAIPFVEDAVDSGQPFFAVVWFHAPHLPVVAGPEHIAPYKNEPSYERNYYGCITALDEQVGRLRKTLRDLGVAENTMLWFCSDNGPEGQANNAPGRAGVYRGRKRDLYEGGVRVPALLEWPARAKPGSATDVPAVTSDYLPTVLDALEIRMPDDRPLDGISLLPVIDGTREERSSRIYFEFRDRVAVMGDRYKLVRYEDGAEYQLFDLLDDPSEEKNIITKYPEIAGDLKTALAAWRVSCRRSAAGADY